jgi:putative transcriptional regulator
MTLTSGTRLGTYQITGLIGVGGMGEIYRASDTKLGREVAIKTLPSELVKTRTASHASSAKRSCSQQSTTPTSHPFTASMSKIVDEPDVRAIRKAAEISQSQFAKLIGVNLRTLQNWEQRRTRPTGPARALLKIVASNPKSALKALHA